MQKGPLRHVPTQRQHLEIFQVTPVLAFYQPAFPLTQFPRCLTLWVGGVEGKVQDPVQPGDLRASGQGTVERGCPTGVSSTQADFA